MEIALAFNIYVKKNKKPKKAEGRKSALDLGKLGFHLFFGLLFSGLFVLAVILTDRWHPIFDFSDPALFWIVCSLVAVCFLAIIVKVYVNRSFWAKYWTDTDYFNAFVIATFSFLAAFYRPKGWRWPSDDYKWIFCISSSLALLAMLMLIFRLFMIFKKSKKERDKNKDATKGNIVVPDDVDLSYLSSNSISAELLEKGFLIEDAPASKDLLNRDGLKKRLTNFIKDYPGGHAFSVGIKGMWGSGKTSLVDGVLKDFEINPDYVVIRDFSIWNYTGEQAMAGGMIAAVMSQLKLGLSAKKIREYTANYLGIVFGETSQPFLSKAAGVVSSLNDSNDGEEVFEWANKYLTKNKKIVVFLIDDIDRVDEDKIMFVYQCVAGILKFENIIYLMCFDERPVNHALKERDLPCQYLNKILNSWISVPMPDSAFLTDFFRRCLLNLFNSLPEFQNKLLGPGPRFNQLVTDCVRCLPTLREFIEFINAVSRFVVSDSSLDFYDSCELSIIMISNPDLYLYLNKNYPARAEKKRGENNQDPFADFGKDYRLTPEWSIVESLLPAVNPSSTEAKIFKAGVRINNLKFFPLYFTFSENFYTNTIKKIKAIDASGAADAEEQLTALLDEDPAKVLSVLCDFAPAMIKADFRKSLLDWASKRYCYEVRKSGSEPNFVHQLVPIISSTLAYCGVEDGKQFVDDLVQNYGWEAVPLLEEAKQTYNYEVPEKAEDSQQIANYAADKERRKIIDVIGEGIFKKETYVKGLFYLLYHFSDSERQKQLCNQVNPDNLACFLFDFARRLLSQPKKYIYALEAREIAGYLPLEKINAMLPSAEVSGNAKKVLDLYRLSLNSNHNMEEQDFLTEISPSSLFKN